MHGLTRRWIVREQPSPQHDSTTTRGLVERLLAARGFRDLDQVKQFCEPKLKSLHDPALLHDIDKAASRIIDALKRDELIVIYGDYDVDGITATAILYHVIKAVQPSARITSYVPHRLEEGYGLNCDALRQLKAEGANLIITVDCGITAVKSAQTARELGVDLIITDHHEFKTLDDSILPDAFALVHPRLSHNSTHYPFADLCGAGVAFKLAWRFACAWCNSQRVSEVLQAKLIEMLPLAALGTIADVSPLLGENRVLCAFGLRYMKHTRLPGLRALIEASGLMDEKIDSEKVGFLLAPRLNACGRMGHAAEAVRMLTEASPQEAAVIAHRLNDANTQRQRVERGIFDEAARLAEDCNMTADECRAIVLAHEKWHPGVVGIVCSRMVERFGRPSILLQKSAEVCKGSGRSIDGYSIHHGLSQVADLLLTFGGHAMAAGVSLQPQNLKAFTDRFTQHANDQIAVENLIPALLIDCDAELVEIDLAATRQLLDLSPFGRGNPAPLLQVSDATIAQSPKQIGQNGKHLSLCVQQQRGNVRRMMRAVWWSEGRRAADLSPGMRVDLVIEPKLNTWNGTTSVEAEIRDVRFATAE